MTAKKVSLKDQPMYLDQDIPRVCTVADVCRIIRMSESQFWNLRQSGKFPIPDLQPPIDNKLRFRGEDVLAYVEGRLAPLTPSRRRKAS